MAETLTVLAIEDERGDAELLRRALGAVPGREIVFLHAASPEAAQAHLARPDVDAIFLDYWLGAETAEVMLSRLRATGDLRPVIVLTGRGDEMTVAKLMRSGADDYLNKGQLDGGTVWRALEHARAQSLRRQFEARNRELLEDLQVAKTRLELQNQRLAELYATAHEFVDHVSHEFRTPLTVIREFAAILRDGLAGAVTAEQHEYLQTIVGRVDDLSVLIEDMLDISKLEAGMLGISRRDCPVREIVERVRATLLQRAATTGVQFTVDVAEHLPDVYCDPEKIGRVIINLVINALKFCGEGGRVVLAARPSADGRTVNFAVRDNGPGIPPESVARLFERFRQVPGSARAGIKGFGLGLSIARELVHLNLGELGVESAVGVGSTFSFTVPGAVRRELMQRYLDRVESFRAGTTEAALWELSAAPAVGHEALEALEHFVQRHTRRSDLLLRLAPHRWLLVTAANSADPGPLLARLQTAHQETSRSRREGPLAELQVRCAGTWRIHDEREALLAKFAELTGLAQAAVA